MQQSRVLVTGAGGEMGHALVPALAARGLEVVALDLKPLPAEVTRHCVEIRSGDVTDAELLGRILGEHRPALVFHLAALLSRQAERDPQRAHRVNVEATMELLRQLRELATASGRGVRFLFPSSIAVYGLPDAQTKALAGAVKETEWTVPSGMYGCTKLYCELAGSYFAGRAQREGTPAVDFRALRFPGLISAETTPTGGTSDYAPEMVHAAAEDRPYACFVREDTRLPFMTMPDAIAALLQLADAPATVLSRRAYNLKGFSPTAGEIRQAVLEHFPRAAITFAPEPSRQALVDTWPGDVDDGLARAEWGLAPRHGLREALAEYLVPSLRRRMAARGAR